MSFKDQFKKAFTPDGKPWPKEEVWTDIEALLPPKKKKRRPIVIWFFGLSALLIGLFVFWPQEDAQLVHEKNQIEFNDGHGTGNSRDLEIHESKDNTSLAEIIKSQTKAIPKPNSIPNEKGDETIGLHDANTLIVDKTVNIDPPSKSIKNNVDDNIVKSNDTNIKKGDIENSSQLSNPRAQIFDQNGASIYEVTTENSNSSVKPLLKHENGSNSNRNIDESEVIGDPHPSLSPWLKYQESLTLGRFINIERLRLMLPKVLERPRSLIEPMFGEEDIVLRTLSTYEWSFALGIGSAFQSISALNSLSEDYAELHQNAVAIREEVYLQSMLRKRFKNGFSVGLGIHYQQSFEWYDGQEVTRTRDTIRQDSARFHHVNGFTTYVSGDRGQTTINRTDYRSPISRHSFDIPLEIGYLRQVGKHSIFAALQFNTNILYRRKGRLYAPNGDLIAQDDPKHNDLIKSNWVNSIGLGAEYRFALSANTALGLGLNYRHQIASSFTDQSGLDERYRSIRFGIAWSRTW